MVNGEAKNGWEGGNGTNITRYIRNIWKMMVDLPSPICATCSKRLIIDMIITSLSQHEDLKAIHIIIRSKRSEQPDISFDDIKICRLPWTAICADSRAVKAYHLSSSSALRMCWLAVGPPFSIGITHRRSFLGQRRLQISKHVLPVLVQLPSG